MKLLREPISRAPFSARTASSTLSPTISDGGRAWTAAGRGVAISPRVLSGRSQASPFTLKIRKSFGLRQVHPSPPTARRASPAVSSRAPMAALHSSLQRTVLRNVTTMTRTASPDTMMSQSPLPPRTNSMSATNRGITTSSLRALTAARCSGRRFGYCLWL